MKKILIVEDDQSIEEVISIIVTEMGYEAIDGSEVRTVHDVEKISPNLILMDLWLTDVDGAKLTVKLKRYQKTKAIPVIVVSAHMKTKDIAKAIGAEGFIAKPFNVLELESTIRQYASG